MRLEGPIIYITDDGFTNEMAEQPDGDFLVTVTAPSGRMWVGQRASIEQAMQLAWQIRTEQVAAASG